MLRTMSPPRALLTAFAILALAACGGPGAPPASETPAATAAAPPVAATPAAEPILLEIRDAAGAQLSGNPQVGGRLFRALCSNCHSVAVGMNGTGPSLHGVIGRAAGTVEGFSYSDANRTSGITWTDQTLFTYLERPAATIPNTTMIFQGVPDAQRRADLIAYLRSESQ